MVRFNFHIILGFQVQFGKLRAGIIVFVRLLTCWRGEGGFGLCLHVGVTRGRHCDGRHWRRENLCNPILQGSIVPQPATTRDGIDDQLGLTVATPRAGDWGLAGARRIFVESLPIEVHNKQKWESGPKLDKVSWALNVPSLWLHEIDIEGWFSGCEAQVWTLTRFSAIPNRVTFSAQMPSFWRARFE